MTNLIGFDWLWLGSFAGSVGSWMSESFAGFDHRWLLVALALLVLAIYVAVSRQVLAIFSRKTLMEMTPDGKHEEVEEYLDHDEEYASSLRGLDLGLRLALVLSLGLGRWMVVQGEGEQVSSFADVALAGLRLAGELLVVFVVFLEIIPGILARMRPEVILSRRLKGMDRIHRFFAPLDAASSTFVRKVVSVLGGKADRSTAAILEEEIITAAEEGEREGLLGSRDKDMIESIITFSNAEVAEVMTPRTKMVCLDLDDPLDRNLQLAVECGHSRIPVYHDSKDNIVGILYVKDLLRYWDRQDSIVQAEMVREPHFVSLKKKIGELFQEFKTQRFHIAIVLDEHGGTSGLITIEDIIEEIVGEITDEHEKVQQPRLLRLGPGVVEVDGAFHIDDLNEELEIDIPESESYETLGGFLSSEMGKIPIVGDVHHLNALRFEVTAADDRRIRRLSIRFPAKGDSFPPASSSFQQPAPSADSFRKRK